MKQQAACLALIPANFSDARGDACIKAVAAAYSDADLSSTELPIVLELAAPCSAIVRGPSGRGETCRNDRDCDGTAGFACVLRGAEASGTCQQPELVEPGQKCAALQQTCSDGFYCDGKNCIAAKDTNDSCSSDYECGELGLCNAESVCVPKLAVGATCTKAEECASGVCYSINGQQSCVDRVRLSPAESLCETFR